MTTRFLYVDVYGNNIEVVMRRVIGTHLCVNCHNTDCCYTQCKIHYLSRKSEQRIPSYIAINVGKKLLECSVNLTTTPRDKLDKEQMIQITCTCGCEWYNSEWEKISNFCTPDCLEEKLSWALSHVMHLEYMSRRTEAMKHIKCRLMETPNPPVGLYGIDKRLTEYASKVFDEIRFDGYNDLTFDGIELFHCKYWETCTFPLCKAMRDHNIGKCGLRHEHVLVHHKMYTQRKRAEVLALVLHTRLGSDSPLGMVDTFTYKQIISLVK